MINIIFEYIYLFLPFVNEYKDQNSFISLIF